MIFPAITFNSKNPPSYGSYYFRPLVYLIKNKINNKIYIGSTSNFHRRFHEYKNRYKRNRQKTSIAEACIKNNYCTQLVRMCCDGKRTTYKNSIWKESEIPVIKEILVKRKI